MRRLGIVLICCMIHIPSVSAAIAFVSRVQNGGAASSTTVASPAQAHTAGNLLVALVHWNDAPTFSSIADTAGNTWTFTGTQLDPTNNHLRNYYAWNCLGNAANIVTATFSSGALYRNITVYEFSGVQTSSDPIDQEKSGTGSGTAISTASFTVSASSEVIINQIIATEPITDATYTLVNFAVTGDAAKYFADAYHITSSNESATATATSGSWGALAASFKIAAAAAATPGTLIISNGGSSTFTITNGGSSTLTITP